MRLHLGLHLNVEDLQGFLRLDAGFTLESDDFRCWVHDGALGCNRPTDGVGRIGHVDDDHLRCLADLLAHADEFIALHRERRERDVRQVDADICELITQTISKYKVTEAGMVIK